MGTPSKGDLYCEKCQRTLRDTNFYGYKDGSKMELCKHCLTLHVDNFDPETFLWILEKADVPYIPTKWNNIRDKAYAKNPNLNGTSVLGKYLSSMKLKPYKDLRWADTEKIQKEEEERRDAALQEQRLLNQFKEVQEKYERGEITESEYKTYMTSEELEKQAQEAPPPLAPTEKQIGVNNPFNEKYFISEDELDDPAAELTQEDRVMLAMKWGRTYRPDEWVALEKDYNEMSASFDIQDADTINTLKLLCKTNLKANQAIDVGDIDGFQKLSRVQDSLRKSAKFTAAQNKESKDNFVDSVGELVAICEAEGGFIPRYDIETNPDVVDAVLKDNNEYVRKLVTEDLGFGQQIETALKRIQIQNQMEATEGDEELEDQDYEDFYDDVADQIASDEEIYEQRSDF